MRVRRARAENQCEDEVRGEISASAACEKTDNQRRVRAWYLLCLPAPGLIGEPRLWRRIFEFVFQGIVQPVVNGIAQADAFYTKFCQLGHRGKAGNAENVYGQRCAIHHFANVVGIGNAGYEQAGGAGLLVCLCAALCFGQRVGEAKQVGVGSYVYKEVDILLSESIGYALQLLFETPLWIAVCVVWLPWNLRGLCRRCRIDTAFRYSLLYRRLCGCSLLQYQPKTEWIRFGLFVRSCAAGLRTAYSRRRRSRMLWPGRRWKWQLP